MNLANKLTVMRVCTIPFFVLFMEIDCLGRWGNFIAVLLFIMASITDALDGHIARKYNLVTNFGKFMDPLADKLLVSAALICLVGRIPAWIVIVIISRELIIDAFRLIASTKGIVMAADIFGKAKTMVQCWTMPLCILLAFLNGVTKVQGTLGLDIFAIVCYVLIGLSTVLTVISGVNYIVKNKQVISSK